MGLEPSTSRTLNPRAAVSCLCLCLRFATEVGTLGRGLRAQSSVFWGAICAGRLLWAAFSHAASTGWLVLALDASVMLLASLVYLAFSAARAAGVAASASSPEWLLWAGTAGLALGFASSIPCSYSLPAEAHIPSTPLRVLTLNLGGSAGEMVMPFVIGILVRRCNRNAEA